MTNLSGRGSENVTMSSREGSRHFNPVNVLREGLYLKIVFIALLKVRSIFAIISTKSSSAVHFHFRTDFFFLWDILWCQFEVGKKRKDALRKVFYDTDPTLNPVFLKYFFL